jgi:allantoate deiminase
MTKESPLKINAHRLWSDLMELSRFGGESQRGVERLALSEADLAARRWFQKRMEEAGLKVKEDAAANLIGRLEPKDISSSIPCVAFGSHIDTVLAGGKFDGALGICAGLEVMRVMQESGVRLSNPLELLIFTDEEGSHYAGTFGSRAMLGMVKEEELEKARKAGQPTLAQDLKRLGKDPGQIKQAQRQPTEFKAFLELHIEQGPVLEAKNIPIGIVEGIADLHRYLIKVKGQAGHAGTTPMALRDDALVKAAEIIIRVHQAVQGGGADVVGTIGEIQVYPGAINIIPAEVIMSLDLRSSRKDKLEAVCQTIKEIVSSLKNSTLEPILVKEGVPMDKQIKEIIAEACRQEGIAFCYLWSGAGHDAMTFPLVHIPTGMIFIPCKEGKSHCPEEEVSPAHAFLGTQVLAETVRRLAS